VCPSPQSRLNGKNWANCAQWCFRGHHPTLPPCLSALPLALVYSYQGTWRYAWVVYIATTEQDPCMLLAGGLWHHPSPHGRSIELNMEGQCSAHRFSPGKVARGLLGQRPRARAPEICRGLDVGDIGTCPMLCYCPKFAQQTPFKTTPSTIYRLEGTVAAHQLCPPPPSPEHPWHLPQR